jgi:hypothetical protein
MEALLSHVTSRSLQGIPVRQRWRTFSQSQRETARQVAFLGALAPIILVLARVLTCKFVDKSPLSEPDQAPAPLGAQYLSPGREPWVQKPSPRPQRPSPARAGEGKGEREGAFNPRLAPRAKLCRSFGAEFFHQPLTSCTSVAGGPAILAAPSSVTDNESAPILIGAGDINDCGHPEGARSTAEILEGYPAATIFAAGDLAYFSGSDAAFRCYDKTWGRPSLRERTRPAVGNHEYVTYGAAGFFKYWRMARQNKPWHGRGP